MPNRIVPVSALLSYNRRMARGWESKSVETQTESSETKPFIVKPAHTPENPRRSAAEIQNIIERRNLELARAKVTRELASAQSPRYVEMLNHALQELNDKLAKLN